jgi:hypothetical protein
MQKNELSSRPERSAVEGPAVRFQLDLSTLSELLIFHIHLSAPESVITYMD